MLIYGTNKEDILLGTADDETIFGLQGDDFIDGGAGSDVIYGDQGNDILSGGEIDPTVDPMGAVDDIVYGGVGADIISGDEHHALLDELPLFGSQVIFYRGNDILFGGEGNDIISGEYDTLSVYFIDLPELGNATVVFGDDILYGEGGDDILVGDNNFGDTSFVNTTIRQLDGLFGSDTLYGGAGNDFLVGDVRVHQEETINCEVTHVHNDGPDNATNDFLYGESGNDILVGDEETQYWGATPADIIITSIVDFEQHFGDDILDGGSGDDLLVGDNMNFTALFDEYTQDNLIEFSLYWGEDILIGGSGNDILWGEVITLNVDPLVNVVSSKDTFQFSLDGMNGNDIVKDMNAGGVEDCLAFSGAADVAAVDAASTFSNSGGHVLMSFMGGSVLFENIAWMGQDSVLEITSDVIVV